MLPVNLGHSNIFLVIPIHLNVSSLKPSLWSTSVNAPRWNLKTECIFCYNWMQYSTHINVVKLADSVVQLLCIFNDSGSSCSTSYCERGIEVSNAYCSNCLLSSFIIDLF